MAKQTTRKEDLTVHTSGTGVTSMDHDVIRAWAESRGGKPAAVEGTEQGGDDVGLIRLEFPDAPNANDDKLTEISWDEFFEKFDANGLALIFQESTADGQKSNFNKLVKRETAERTTATPTTSARKTATTKTTATKTDTKKAAPKATAKKVAPTAKKAASKKSAPAMKKSAAKKAPAAKTAAKKTPAGKRTTAAKKSAAKPAVAKKADAKKAAKKVPAARGYRGR